MHHCPLRLVTLSLAIFLAGCSQSDWTDLSAVSEASNQSAILSSGDVSAASRFEAPPSTAVGTSSQAQERLQATHVNRVRAARFDNRYMVAVEAHTRSAQSIGDGFVGLSPGDSLWLSVTDATDPGSQWEAVIVPPRPVWTRMRIEHIGRDSVVVRQCSSDYGFCEESIKLFLDRELKKALGRSQFQPLVVSGFVVLDGAFYSVAVVEENGHVLEYVVARYDTGRPVLVNEIERDMAIAALPEVSVIRSAGARNRFQESGPLDSTLSPAARPNYYVPMSSELTSEPALWLSQEPIGFVSDIEGVVERIGDVYYLHALPQSTPDEFARRRSTHQFVQRNVSIGQSQVQEEIGPYTILANRLWFGKTFYDGEGIVGVGALGYFDLKKRAYTLFSPPAIADWSTSAILVEEDALWAGLVRRPEGASHSGGLLRYDLSAGRTEIYSIDHVIGAMKRWGDALYLGTEEGGVYVVRERGAVARYVFEPALDGGFEILAIDN